MISATKKNIIFRETPVVQDNSSSHVKLVTEKTMNFSNYIGDLELKALLLGPQGYTYWIAPEITAKIYEVVPDSDSSSIVVPGIKQSLWIINKVDGRYFFGCCYTYINFQPVVFSQFAGSIQINGQCLMQFYGKTPTGSSYLYPVPGNFVFLPVDTPELSSTLNEIFEYQFIVQIDEFYTVPSVMHCSYMKAITEISPEFSNLPGTHNLSVPQVIQGVSELYTPIIPSQIPSS
jgi:hypothetical protein